MVLTTPEALEQRTALATRAVEELRGYGLNVQDTVASVVDRTTARFSSQREVIDHTFLDGARADLVRRYGGQNAEGALATMRARDFILHDVQRVQNGYDNFLDGRTSPGMLANSLETLQNELTRYGDINRFDSQSQRHAREAGEIITRLMESLRHYPDDMNQRIDANNRIFHEFNSLERAMDNFASGTNNQIMALLESRAEPAVQVAQAPQPPPRTTSVRTRETMVSQQFGGMRDGGYVQIPREQRIEPPAVVVRQEPVQQPRVEAPQRPVVEEPQRTRGIELPSTRPSVRPIPPIEPVVVQAPPRVEPVAVTRPQPEVVQTPTTTVRTSERPAVAVQQGLIAIDTPAGQRQLGVLLRTQNPQEPEFSQQQLAEVGRVFSEVRRYAHFREEWNQTAQDGLLRAYHEGGRAQFLNELGTFAQMSYNPDRDTNPSDSRLDGIRASMRSTTVAATRTEAPVQERRQEAIVTENPSVTMFNDRVRDGNQTVDGVRDAAARVHQARLDAEEAARRGDATAFERAQRIAREATPANPMQSFDNYLGYARGAKDQVPTAERRGIEPTYRALEGRRRELSGYQTAIDADLAAIGRIRIQRR